MTKFQVYFTAEGSYGMLLDTEDFDALSDESTEDQVWDYLEENDRLLDFATDNTWLDTDETTVVSVERTETDD